MAWTRLWQNLTLKADRRIRRPPKKSSIGWRKIIIISRPLPDGSTKVSSLRSTGTILRAGKIRPLKENVSWPLLRDEIPIIKFTLIKLMIIELKISFSVVMGW